MMAPSALQSAQPPLQLAELIALPAPPAWNGRTNPRTAQTCCPAGTIPALSTAASLMTMCCNALKTSTAPATPPLPRQIQTRRALQAARLALALLDHGQTQKMSQVTARVTSSTTAARCILATTLTVTGPAPPLGLMTHPTLRAGSGGATSLILTASALEVKSQLAPGLLM